MTTTTIRTRLLASSMISGAAIAAVSVTGAQAQQAAAPAPAASSTSVQELVVTGSRIPQKNLTSVSPVTTVNSQAIKLQGTTNVEDLINNLPQAFADFGTFETNGASGTSTIDLRGLGNVRTLVLVDGKRLQPGDPNVPVADINMIPPALIDRVEVLTGGASAVYGSDAVAGVVNFIMKHNFEGLQFDGEYSVGEHDNNSQQARAANAYGQTFGLPDFKLPSGAVWAGGRYTATITGGANSPDEKGNVEFYLGYTHLDAVTQDKYDWSKCSLTTSTGTTKQYCLGSSNDATGRLIPVSTSGPGTHGSYNILGTPETCTLGTCMQGFNRNQDFNFAPYQYLQRADERYTAGEFSHYEVAPWLDLYSSFMFMDDHTVAHLGPSAAFLGNTFTIPCNDPLLSSAQLNTLCGGSTTAPAAQVLIGRRNVEGGPRVFDTTHTDYRIVFGAKGDFGQGWTYDVSMQYGRSVLTDVDTNQMLVSHIANALDVVPGPNGTAVCASGAAGCVPWNIWSPNGVTQAALNYVQGTAADSGYTTEQVVTGSIAGDLGQYGMKSPWASDGVGVSIGAEYRREFLTFIPDAVEQSGDISGSGTSAPTSGSQSDKDVFGEIRIPIVQDMPFFKNLTFEGGGRYSDYTHGGGNWTYKAGLDWQVVPDLRLRASYERAVRAPNVDELFGPQVQGLFGGGDPCSGATPTYTAAQCARTGVTAAQYGHITPCVSGQCGLVSGGNPDLKPEIGKTWSVGAVFTPSFFRGFSASVDYFDITVDGEVNTLPPQQILAGCAIQDLAADCALIKRNPIGLLFGTGFVQATDANIASLETSGLDVNADYRTSLSNWGLGDHGSLDLNFTGSYLEKRKTTLLGVGSWDCAGLYGVTCGEPAPKWRHQARLSWVTPWNLTLSVAWRYLGPSNLDFNTSQPLLAQASPTGAKDISPTDAHIPAFNYFDVSFQYKFRNRYTIRGGINNIFDRTPPILDTNNYGISSPAFGNANTFPQIYDPLGRVFFVGVTADF